MREIYDNMFREMFKCVVVINPNEYITNIMKKYFPKHEVDIRLDWDMPLGYFTRIKKEES